MKKIRRFPRVGMQILFVGFLLAMLGGCVSVTCPNGCCGDGGGSDPAGCTGTTTFSVPNAFNCTHAVATSNICPSTVENIKKCGFLNSGTCKTVNPSGAGNCNCSCM